MCSFVCHLFAKLFCQLNFKALVDLIYTCNVESQEENCKFGISLKYFNINGQKNRTQVPGVGLGSGALTQ